MNILVNAFEAPTRQSGYGDFPGDLLCLDLETGQIQLREEENTRWRMIPCSDSRVEFSLMEEFVMDLGVGEPSTTLWNLLLLPDPLSEFRSGVVEVGLQMEWKSFLNRMRVAELEGWLQELGLPGLSLGDSSITWKKPNAEPALAADGTVSEAGGIPPREGDHKTFLAA